MERRKFITTATRTAAVIPILGSAVFAEKPPAPAYELNEKPILPQANDTGRRNFFFRPVDAWAADFIPLYADEKFQLFYLHDWRDVKKHGEGTPWYRLSTKDFINFEEHGEAIPRGTKNDQDLYVFTGSAIKADGKYHIFYTGHNPYLAAQGKPVEGIMHAVSVDLQNWEKTGEQIFFAPEDMYEPNDWRDPFVFRNEETKEYCMLCAARFKKGIPRRRGLTVLSTSKDLVTWKVEGPFYAPGLYYTHECPDLFKMGDWWYLVFSEFTDLVRTRYRMSRSLKGPWLTPGNDSFDGHAFYAAKTASDGKKRFIFGWNPTRSDHNDNGDWNWGGNLVVHEICQQPDGELSVRVPDSIAAAFDKPVLHAFTTHTDQVTIHNNAVEIKAPGSFGAALGGIMPGRCKIEATINFDKATRGCGLMLRTSEDFEKTYYIRLEPLTRRLVFDLWPRSRNEIPFMVELERDMELAAGVPVHLRVFIDGTVGVVYANNKIAMNFRLYDLHSGNWGVFVKEGNATFGDVTIFTT